MTRPSLSFQSVHEGVVASVTTQYATRDCGETTEQLSTVDLKCVNWKVTLSGCIDLGAEADTARDGRAPYTEGAVAYSPFAAQPPWVKGFMLKAIFMTVERC